MNIKPIAIYFPQYHVIPINERFWGAGFTDWHNVKKAKPCFEGHYQPHVPHESVGYYDLSDPDVLIRQAEMARSYGIYGFAFYHYWFNGERLLQTPLDNMLKFKKPNFPFFYIWANEPWTTSWDGVVDPNKNGYIQEQLHSLEDDINHIKFLCENVFSDDRYIKIDNKPVFAVYRTGLFSDIHKTSIMWRKISRSYGFKDLYLIKINSFGDYTNAKNINFDMNMEFLPNFQDVVRIDHNQCDYKKTMLKSIENKYEYPVIKTTFPAWDNTARKSENKKYHTIFSNLCLETFELSLKNAIEYTNKNHDHGIFCINAWNEWAEGCHIEPDVKNGYAYLQIIKRTTQKYK
jgi:lipopolysaccharide biosynthesis protein